MNFKYVCKEINYFLKGGDACNIIYYYIQLKCMDTLYNLIFDFIS